LEIPHFVRDDTIILLVKKEEAAIRPKSKIIFPRIAASSSLSLK
jgi:hypothetical protein